MLKIGVVDPLLTCGASIEVILRNTCKYCKNIMVQTSNELVLNKKVISSRKW